MAQKQQRYWDKTLKYYWENLKPYKWYFFGALIAVGIAVILSDVVAQYYIGQLIDELFEFENGNSSRSEVLQIFVIIIVALAGKAVLFRVAGYWDVITMNGLIKNNQSMVFRELSKRSYNFFTNNFGGSLVNKFNQFKWSGLELLLLFIYSFFLLSLRLAVFSIVLIFIFPQVALLLIGWSLLYMFSIAWMVRKKVPISRKTTAARSRSTGVFSDVITNILTVKSFARTKQEEQKFEEVIESERDITKKSWFIDHWIRVYQEFMLFVLTAGTLAISAHGVLNGFITAGTVVIAQLYVNRVSGDMFQLSHNIRSLEKHMNNAFEMTEIFETPLHIKNPSIPESLETGEGLIDFKEVDFVYSDGNDKVLENFNLKIKPGQKVGLVGHSGSGKTTLTKLLLRYEDVSGGQVLIDNQDVRHVLQEDLRSKIATVPQEPILFHRSIADNIRYGDPDASDKDVIKVAKQANAHDFIKDLPKGYDTLVGERGIKLSGGEKQRVAIARAMLSKAPILLLDEATSALDSKSENLIQIALDRLMKNRTTIVIAHRLSTIRMMDRIVVMQKGKIIEDGSHDELLEKNGQYAQLWAHQAGGFLTEG